MAEDSSLAAKVAGEAASSILNVLKTRYTHEIHIDDTAGIYDCDCSGFVEYLLSRTAPNHLTPLRDLSTDNDDERPLAHDFYTFFSRLPTTESDGTNGWLQITTLGGTTRGDIVAWNLHDSNEPGDTGHVFVVAEAPTPLIGGHDSSVTFAVNVYDSSSKEHFNDSRGDGDDFKGGVGSGTLHIQVDAGGAPVRFRFSETSSYHMAPIAIGRIEPFLSG
jgi:hypothetical protein